MIYRRYLISISPKHHHSLPTGLEQEFGCSVSEPSNWLEPGSTLERGLTFLDVMGHELHSDAFIHLRTFPRPDVKTSEKKEIEALIFNRIFEVFHIDPTTVHVHVADY